MEEPHNLRIEEPSCSNDVDDVPSEAEEDTELKFTDCTIVVHDTRRAPKISPPNAALVGLCQFVGHPHEEEHANLIPVYMSGKKRRSTLKKDCYKLDEVLIWRDCQERTMIVIIMPGTTMQRRDTQMRWKKRKPSFDQFSEMITIPSSTVNTVKYHTQSDKPVVYVEGVASEVDPREEGIFQQARSVFKLCDERDQYISVVLYHKHIKPPKIGERACIGLSSFKTFTTKERNYFNCISSTDYSTLELLEEPNEHILSLMDMDFEFDTGMEQLKGIITKVNEPTVWNACPECPQKELNRNNDGTFSCSKCGGQYQKTKTKKGYSMKLFFDSSSNGNNKQTQVGVIFKNTILDVMHSFAIKRPLHKTVLMELRLKLVGQKAKITSQKKRVGLHVVFSNIRFLD